MSGRLQLIEQKLMAIDSAGFQNLCDVFLFLRENEIINFNRTGSQLGKLKTIPGTPDSFYRTEDYRLICVEYTTQSGSLIRKLKSDISKCLDPTIIGVDREHILKIVCFFNSKLLPKLEAAIVQFALDQKIKIELIGIDTLAIKILTEYPQLSRDFLDIPVDTGQILTLSTFISEYDNKAFQLSTPLNNLFLHRTEDLEDISNQLCANDILVISGAPGVGKTKIGLEAIYRFVQKNPAFQAYAISKKDVDIFDDLRIHLKKERDYILLIDDANRQLLNLEQILGFFRELRKGTLKVIITVRNYAYNDLLKHISDLKHYSIQLQKFSDEEIIEILKSDSFGILNHNFHQKIVEVADGNARLAIMAAKLALIHQGNFLWHDVSDLYDSYFQTFLKDFDIFDNSNLVKTLAIISFFFTVDLTDKDFILVMLRIFGIDYYQFNESIHDLNNRELIEIRYGHARISEQVLATYFFYKVFIKEEFLSFNDLLINYFPKYKPRFKESVISANNSFGNINIYEKIKDSLHGYLRSVSENEEKTLDFLDLFWFYLPGEILNHFYLNTLALPEPEEPIYFTQYNQNDFIFNKDLTIDFTSRFFFFYSEWFEQAIELSFEFVRKKPQRLPELIKNIQEHLLFDERDERNGFQRQVIFINHIIKRAKNGENHYRISFQALAITFLQHTYHNSHGARKNKFVMYEYPLPFYEVTQELRRNIWNAVFYFYDKYPDETLEILMNYKPMYHKLIPEILEFDLKLLMPFIQENLNPAIFINTYFVHEMIYWLDREPEIINRDYRNLLPAFSTDEYFDYCKIDWNKLRDKNSFDFENTNEYELLKIAELKKSFVFTKDQSFDRLLKAMTNSLSVQRHQYFLAANSIDIIIEENFKKNQEIGFSLLKEILYKFPKDLPVLNRTISFITSRSKKWCHKLWNELQIFNNEKKLDWKLNFFIYLPDKYIDNYFCHQLELVIQTIDKYAYIDIVAHAKFLSSDPHIISSIFQITNKKTKEEGIEFMFTPNLFEDHLDLFNDDYSMIKETYFQQHNFNHSQIFDFRKQGFKRIFEIYPEFFIDFISESKATENERLANSDNNLTFIWDSQLNFSLIHRAFEILLAKNSIFDLTSHSIDFLFNSLNAEQKTNACTFLKQYIQSIITDSRGLFIIFDSIRNNLPDQFEEFLLYYLSLNSDPENFKKVDWVGNVGVISGEANFGVLYADRWSSILEIVNKFPDKFAIIPLKNYINKKIEDEYRSAEYERKQKFLLPDW